MNTVLIQRWSLLLLDTQLFISGYRTCVNLAKNQLAKIKVMVSTVCIFFLACSLSTLSPSRVARASLAIFAYLSVCVANIQCRRKFKPWKRRKRWQSTFAWFVLIGPYSMSFPFVKCWLIFLFSHYLMAFLVDMKSYLVLYVQQRPGIE